MVDENDAGYDSQMLVIPERNPKGCVVGLPFVDVYRPESGPDKNGLDDENEDPEGEKRQMRRGHSYHVKDPIPITKKDDGGQE